MRIPRMMMMTVMQRIFIVVSVCVPHFWLGPRSRKMMKIKHFPTSIMEWITHIFSHIARHHAFYYTDTAAANIGNEKKKVRDEWGNTWRAHKAIHLSTQNSVRIPAVASTFPYHSVYTNIGFPHSFNGRTLCHAKEMCRRRRRRVLRIESKCFLPILMRLYILGMKTGKTATILC